MTAPDQLAAIEARVEAATEGPWKATQEATIIAPIPRSDDAYWLFKAHAAHTTDQGPSEDCTADAEFIAHARTDIPALLALVREQAAQLEAVRGLCADREDWGLVATRAVKTALGAGDE